ncbi:MAG TPA: alkene reductase [Rugosibacter sp.]
MTTTKDINLFSPIQLGPYTLKNRMTMAPMTRNRANEANAPHALNVEYYRQRASAGLIITEGAIVSAAAAGYPGTPGIYSPEQVAGWRQVTDAVHREGGRIFLQLWHCGRASHKSLLPNDMLPVAPSAIKPVGETLTYTGMQAFETPHALTMGEIPDIIEMFRHGAQCALEAGFDGVEIHGANGYLVDQFLRDGTNQRTDAYGGSIANRARFLLEVTEAVCSVWGANRVGIRLSPLGPFNDMHDSNPEATFSYAVKALNHFGLAYLHIAAMGSDKPGAGGPAFDLFKLRDLWTGLYMANYGYDLVRGNAVLADGRADMIAFGVPFLANPDLPRRFAEGAALNAPDVATFYGGNGKGYTDYPFLAK